MIALSLVISLIPNAIGPTSLVAPYDGYQYVARAYQSFECDTTAPVDTGFGDFVLMHNTLNVNFNVSYNSPTDYILYNFTFTLRGKPMYYDDSSVSETYSGFITATYSPDWEFTYSTYNDNFLSTFVARSFIDDDTEFYVGFRLNNTPVGNSDSAYLTVHHNLPNPSSQNDMSFYTDDFISSVENYIKASLYQNTETAFTDGYNAGWSDGWRNGYEDGSSSSSTAATIFAGIIDIGLTPVNFFLAILNFEVFGINIGGFVSALLTIAIVVILLRFVLGRTNNS